MNNTINFFSELIEAMLTPIHDVLLFVAAIVVNAAVYYSPYASAVVLYGFTALNALGLLLGIMLSIKYYVERHKFEEFFRSTNDKFYIAMLTFSSILTTATALVCAFLTPNYQAFKLIAGFIMSSLVFYLGYKRAGIEKEFPCVNRSKMPVGKKFLNNSLLPYQLLYTEVIGKKKEDERPIYFPMVWGA